MVMTMTMVVTTMMEAELVGPNTPPLRILLTQVKNMVVVAAAWWCKILKQNLIRRFLNQICCFRVKAEACCGCLWLWIELIQYPFPFQKATTMVNGHCDSMLGLLDDRHQKNIYRQCGLWSLVRISSRKCFHGSCPHFPRHFRTVHDYCLRRWRGWDRKKL